MRIRTMIAVAAAAALAPAAPAAAGWQQTAGGPLDADPSRHAASADAALVGGAPHVAWVEQTGSDSGDTSVLAARMRPDGSWEPLGRLSTGGSQAIEPDVAEIGGTLYAAWSEKANGVFQVKVARLTESGFQTLAPAVNRSATVEGRDPSLTAFEGLPHIAWSEPGSDGGFEVWVARLENGAWTQVGGPINRSSRDAAAQPIPILRPAQENGTDPDLEVIGGVLHVAFIEGGLNTSADDVRVAYLRRGDSAWLEYGDGGPLSTSGLQVDLESVGGVPFAAWRSAEGRFAIRVARLGAGGWDGVGDAVNPTGSAGRPSLLDIGGTPWLGFEQAGDARVARLTGTAPSFWQPVAGALDGSSTASGPVLLAKDGIPWAAFSDGVLTSRQDVRVSRLVPDFLAAEAAATATTATLSARLRTYGLRYQVGFAYGEQGAGLPLRTALTNAGGEEATVAVGVAGLDPRTAYEMQPLAVAGPEVRGPLVSFATTRRNGKD